ncbi:hypothetical protein CANCADRAFT_75070 [Tortispora caseinolytica NRRL Y-17796]|uniref:RING-type domain-containing protein n=1 Tax=Tortispora caseinolytica NRRL Y-17796 TaxID=767744 RepID=A0A1E4TIY1_9ASCO|nr:hypothetical protein CANCADRAFT_75070 [Tortispora caseinolytica NRRL Y-17796]
MERPRKIRRVSSEGLAASSSSNHRSSSFTTPRTGSSMTPSNSLSHSPDDFIDISETSAGSDVQLTQVVPASRPRVQWRSPVSSDDVLLVDSRSTPIAQSLPPEEVEFIHEQPGSGISNVDPFDVVFTNVRPAEPRGPTTFNGPSDIRLRSPELDYINDYRTLSRNSPIPSNLSRNRTSSLRRTPAIRVSNNSRRRPYQGALMNAARQFDNSRMSRPVTGFLDFFLGDYAQPADTDSSLDEITTSSSISDLFGRALSYMDFRALPSNESQMLEEAENRHKRLVTKELRKHTKAKNHFSNSIEPAKTMLCTRCDNELCKPRPLQPQNELGTDDPETITKPKLTQKQKARAPQPLPELESRTFACSKCGHLYCGRCVTELRQAVRRKKPEKCAAPECQQLLKGPKLMTELFL